MIFQWWGKIEKGSVTLYKRLRNRGYHVIAVNDSQDTAPRIDNETALALAEAILEDLGLGWKPYPENTPDTKGEYDVTFYDQVDDVYWVSKARWDIYKDNNWSLTNNEHGYAELTLHPINIIAYRALSAPYQP